jgi:hypothetical protein
MQTPSLMMGKPPIIKARMADIPCAGPSGPGGIAYF